MKTTTDLKQQVDLSKTTQVSCEECDGKTFKQTVMLRKLSALVSPTGSEVLIPVAVFGCEHCNHINSEFVDSELTL